MTGDVIVSLVIAFIYKDFILACGEQRAVLDNGTILDDFVKVQKINSTTIIGMTGTIQGNAKLFSEYVNDLLQLKNENCVQSYSEINKRILINFEQNYDYLQENPVHSFICGWNGNKMTGQTFFTKDFNLQPINDISPLFDGHVNYVCCGLEQHKKNLEAIGHETNPQNILQFKNLFKDVIARGIKFDNSINNKITFEKIRRVDVG